MYADVGEQGSSRFGLDVRLLRLWHRPGAEEPGMLAQDLLARGRADDALRVTQLGLEREPDDADLLLVRGLTWLRLGDKVRAQRALTRAASVAPDWLEPWRWLGEVLVQREQMGRAQRIFEHVLSLGEQDPQVRERAKTIARLGGIQDRLERFARDPQCEEPAMLACDLLTVGRLDDALDVAYAGLADDSEDPDLQLACSRVLRARGEHDAADEALERALELAPDWVEPWRDRAQQCLEQDAPRQARQAVERGLSIAPGDRALQGTWIAIEAMLEELEPEELEPEPLPVEPLSAEPLEPEPPEAEPLASGPLEPEPPVKVAPVVEARGEREPRPAEDIALDELLASFDDTPLPGPDTLPGYPAPLELPSPWALQLSPPAEDRRRRSYRPHGARRRRGNGLAPPSPASAHLTDHGQ